MVGQRGNQEAEDPSRMMKKSAKCHPERSEGSRTVSKSTTWILRCVQNDSARGFFISLLDWKLEMHPEETLKNELADPKNDERTRNVI
jgi:hypothetical protein